MFRVVGLTARLRAKQLLVSCHVMLFQIRVVMSLNLVPSCCNKECLSMCALSKIRLSFKFETFLHMIARPLDKPLQMTTLVNFAFPPKNVGKPKHF
jgi:hypothetical protein